MTKLSTLWVQKDGLYIDVGRLCPHCGRSQIYGYDLVEQDQKNHVHPSSLVSSEKKLDSCAQVSKDKLSIPDLLTTLRDAKDCTIIIIQK